MVEERETPKVRSKVFPSGDRLGWDQCQGTNIISFSKWNHQCSDILEEHLLEFATNFPDGWQFKQDNAPPHRAKITQDWF